MSDNPNLDEEAREEEHQSSPSKAIIEDEFSFDISMKKKKKKKKPEQLSTESNLISDPISSLAMTEDGNQETLNSKEKPLDSNRDFTYKELLERAFRLIRQNNPDLAGERRKFVLVPPQVGREGSKKTAFANIADICRRMRRPIDHLVQFLLTEMGTTGSIDGTQRFIIRGRFTQAHLETLIRRYVNDYVTCPICRMQETNLIKEQRLLFLQCESCGSKRAVNAIKTGFQAQTGKRSAQRQE